MYIQSSFAEYISSTNIWERSSHIGQQAVASLTSGVWESETGDNFEETIFQAKSNIGPRKCFERRVKMKTLYNMMQLHPPPPSSLLLICNCLPAQLGSPQMGTIDWTFSGLFIERRSGVWMIICSYWVLPLSGLAGLVCESDNLETIPQQLIHLLTQLEKYSVGRGQNQQSSIKLKWTCPSW